MEPTDLILEVFGAGSEEVNGNYAYGGTYDDRPYFLKTDNSGMAIWHFRTIPFPSSLWNGWYISKNFRTSFLSAKNDFYSAYTQSPHPPSQGWVTRQPGVTPAAGCGQHPPPAIRSVSSASVFATHPSSPDSATVAKGSETSKSTKQSMASFGPVPESYEIAGAGCIEANGKYVFSGFLNNRPFYEMAARNESGIRPGLWYFHSEMLKMSKFLDYTGWYVSRAVDSSSVSASTDMYSSYQHSRLPPTASKHWVVRAPGFSPAAGCGKSPVPHSIIPSSHLIVQLCVQSPTGSMFQVRARVGDHVRELHSRLQVLTGVPTFCQRLVVRGTALEGVIDASAIQDGDVAVMELLDHSALVSRAAKMQNTLQASVPNSKIVVVGAGPVGLWVAVQLRLWCPELSVVCFEKRETYERSHALKIDSFAFDGMFEGCPELIAMKQKWQPRTRTKDVEADLLALATKLGVEMKRGHTVSTVEEVLTSEQGVVCVVCCDGARSECRKAASSIWSTVGSPHTHTHTPPSEDDEFRYKETLGSLIQVKFDARGRVQRAEGPLAKLMQNLPARQQFFNVLPGNHDASTDITPVTMFALLNSTVADCLREQGCNSSTPFHSIGMLSDAVPNSALSTDLANILEQSCPSLIPESMRISVLPVCYHVARQPCWLHNAKVPVFLAGDAAMGLPLEKGLNHGWRIASHLCRFIAAGEGWEVACKDFSALFDERSHEAVSNVNEDYAKYLNTVRVAGWARGFVNVLVNHNHNHYHHHNHNNHNRNRNPSSSSSNSSNNHDHDHKHNHDNNSDDDDNRSTSHTINNTGTTLHTSTSIGTNTVHREPIGEIVD